MKFIKYLFLALAAMLISVASLSYVAPSIPAAQSPHNGEVVTDYTPTLFWSASRPATGTTLAGYQVQTSLVSDFSFTTVTYNLPVSITYTIPNSDALDPGKTYYWHVRAKNNLGEWSAWSNTANFHTAIKRPTPVSPLNGDTSATNATLLDLRPTFNWTSYTGSQTFTLQVAKGCDFTKPVIDVNVAYTASQYTPGVDLAPDTYFCWRVRANNSSYGPSAWTDIQSFLTANPPSVAVLVDPLDKTLTNDNSPRLDWGDVAVAAGTTFDRYQVEIANSSDFSTYKKCDPTFIHDHRLIDVYSGSLYDVPDQYTPPAHFLLGACTYYWRVRSYNTNGERSAWSAIRSLSITVDRPYNLNISPNPPTDPRPLFTWSKIYQAELYRITITSPDIAKPIVDTTVRLPRYLPTADLPSGVDIYWSVYAIDGNLKYGQSLPSDTQTFLSANAPTPPVLKSPPDDAHITDTTPTLKWSISVFPAGTTFDHYEVKIAENTKFTINLISHSTTARLFTAALSYDRTYYWTVRTCNTDGQCSSWADTRSFYISH